MSGTRIWRRLISGVAVVTVALVLAACSSEEGSSSAATAAPQTPVTEMTLVMRDNKFDQKAFTVPANTPVTVTTDNKGSALHNFHVINIKSADGKDIVTQLIPGGRTDTVTFTIDTPGTYDYRCDVHPEMTGKLTVQ